MDGISEIPMKGVRSPSGRRGGKSTVGAQETCGAERQCRPGLGDNGGRGVAAASCGGADCRQPTAPVLVAQIVGPMLSPAASLRSILRSTPPSSPLSPHPNPFLSLSPPHSTLLPPLSLLPPLPLFPSPPSSYLLPPPLPGSRRGKLDESFSRRADRTTNAELQYLRDGELGATPHSPAMSPPLRRAPRPSECWVASASAPVKSGLRLALRATAGAALLTGGSASGYGLVRSRTRSSTSEERVGAGREALLRRPPGCAPTPPPRRGGIGGSDRG